MRCNNINNINKEAPITCKESNGLILEQAQKTSISKTKTNDLLIENPNPAHFLSPYH